MKLDITKEKLRNAAYKLLAECDSHKEVTSRAIAKEAGVQLAMINYCFGSREALLYEVFKDMYSEEFRKRPEMAAILSSDIPPKEKLREMHYLVAEFLLEHETISKAIAKYVLLNRDLSEKSNSLPFVVAHYKGRLNLKECQLIAYELSSMMQLLLSRHEEIKKCYGIDMKEKEQLKSLIDMRIDMLLVD